MRMFWWSLGLAWLTVSVSTSAGALPAELPALPLPVSNNAVAMLRSADGLRLYSLMGLSTAKQWDAITSRAFELRVDTRQEAWREIAEVPGARGRIAATAAGVAGKVYLFGGYTVAADGSEDSVPDVDVYDPVSGRWSRGADLPVPVDDAVSGVYRGRWIYLVSGWSQRGNVAHVQIYDTANDSWRQATPIPGAPVFGHTGGLAGATIVYCGGAVVAPPGSSPRFRSEPSCWRGRIAANDLAVVDWARLPLPPGVALYRGAAGATADGRRVVFVGGTDNPYNIDGVGYDEQPSEPVAAIVAFDVESEHWIELGRVAEPTMDHRGLLLIDGAMIRVGGMTAGQRVSADVRVDAIELP